MTNDANRPLLDAVNAAALWFRAWKVEPIWVKALEHAQSVETIEGDVSPLAGDVLCRGKSGEIWPQPRDRLLEKYRPTEIREADGWTLYEPRPGKCGVDAARIDHPFSVETARGRLEGKAGDYLVKGQGDWDNAYPERIWIVDRDLFEETYTSEES